MQDADSRWVAHWVDERSTLAMRVRRRIADVLRWRSVFAVVVPFFRDVWGAPLPPRECLEDVNGLQARATAALGATLPKSQRAADPLCCRLSIRRLNASD